MQMLSALSAAQAAQAAGVGLVVDVVTQFPSEGPVFVDCLLQMRMAEFLKKKSRNIYAKINSPTPTYKI